MPLPKPQVCALQAGGLDANGQTPEIHVSDGGGTPCRGEDHRIVHGMGAVVPTAGLAEETEARLADAPVAYIHARSARSTC